MRKKRTPEAAASGVRSVSRRVLFEPVDETVFRVEIVDEQADPAGAEHEDGADDLAHQADGFLDDVEDRDDREHDAYL